MRHGGSYIRRGDKVERVAYTGEAVAGVVDERPDDFAPGEQVDDQGPPPALDAVPPPRKGGKANNDITEE